MTPQISLASARRIALAAQGFGERRSDAARTWRHMSAVLARTGLFQIDSVSAVVRAHYMPAFSRLGAYPRRLIDDAAARRPRRLFEYWAHEASYLPVETWPLMQWRMHDARDNRGIYGGLARFGRERADYIETIFRKVEAEGPLAASAIDGQKGEGGWWGWSDAKHAFEWLFWAGRITTASRRGFERLYDLPERVIPRAIHDQPTPARADAIRRLLKISADALGVATAADLRDYFRLSPNQADGRIAELVENGDLVPVKVEGWSQKAFLAAGTRVPRRIRGSALLAPFDPLIWERGRTERLFGFRYRIEIYTPAHKRTHGYYVLPWLLDEALAARLDLKADRAARVLRMNGAFAEEGAPRHVAQSLARDLRLMAEWLDLDDVVVTDRGDLAPALAEALRTT
ncbi:winged helix-turn-helix domain-containing protein [Aquibium carbonis]|uniref:Winged helix-turn-helix domain-containing protein n=1 Tax=Aquibium carbonis TaxID=2495581 RepID=A0A3S0A772_9HYPH|nr:winged helix-turn-helix domain-containing protein [Aquibium carbonis]RST86274.1 winged helix-turn-helix domain-containing protein [Aquibium carbonis]